ncbi:MAG: VanZ family protein [Bacteroidales bacterium]|nr:VanZ family protein [Bacteroidales bacterium]MCB8999782.1 VanZ family protein [Bacteroidales bacterium]
MKLIKFILRYYPSIIVFILIFIASIIPARDVEKVSFFTFPHFDKLVHAIMYFTFSFVIIFDNQRSRPPLPNIKNYLYSAVAGLSYGGIMEILQALFTRSRKGDIFDFLFDLLGVVLAIGLWSLLKKSK